MQEVLEDELEGYRTQIINKEVVLSRKKKESWQIVRGKVQAITSYSTAPQLGVVVRINYKNYDNIDMSMIRIVIEEKIEPEEKIFTDSNDDYHRWPI